MASGITALADVAPADEQYFYHPLEIPRIS